MRVSPLGSDEARESVHHVTVPIPLWWVFRRAQIDIRLISEELGLHRPPSRSYCSVQPRPPGSTLGFVLSV